MREDKLSFGESPRPEGRGDSQLISSIDVNIRAHAMSYPEVGFMERRDNLLKEMSKLEDFGIYFAHSDISSISIFEEASWWGYSAAQKILKV